LKEANRWIELDRRFEKFDLFRGSPSKLQSFKIDFIL